MNIHDAEMLRRVERDIWCTLAKKDSRLPEIFSKIWQRRNIMWLTDDVGYLSELVLAATEGVGGDDTH
jgi:hypothetical protein